MELGQLIGKELIILFAASAFRKMSSIYVFSYFPFGFEGRIWDLIVSVPDHCLSFYFAKKIKIVRLTLRLKCKVHKKINLNGTFYSEVLVA